MATTLASQPVTIREYLKFKSPEGFRDELIYGKIVVSPEPKILHFQIADNLYKLLGKTVGKKFRVAQRVNLRLPAINSMPSPDVFVIERDEYNSAMQSGSYPDGRRVPLVVEVLSPGNRKKAVQLKLGIYRRHGIEAWVVDPKHREIKVYRGREESTLSADADEMLPLPTALGTRTLPLSKIFDLLA